jgi:hypothetical protein
MLPDGVTCLPGWAIVERAETEDTYRGSSIIIPDYVRDRVARDQFEVVHLAPQNATCVDTHCERPHDAAGYHQVPDGLQKGSWVVLGPRSLVGIPGETTRWLAPIDAIWCRLG